MFKVIYKIEGESYPSSKIICGLSYDAKQQTARFSCFDTREPDILVRHITENVYMDILNRFMKDSYVVNLSMHPAALEAKGGKNEKIN